MDAIGYLMRRAIRQLQGFIMPFWPSHMKFPKCASVVQGAQPHERIMRQPSLRGGRPVPRAVIDPQNLNCLAGNPVHDDVWKARDDQLACAR
jgi:hypothetical protein